MRGRAGRTAWARDTGALFMSFGEPDPGAEKRTRSV